ncbi:phosphonate metabolism protein/1,5-bisphosphokinase (PRPP-forming) PhnN [Pseudomonas sp. GV071]|uniref:phosphonate metabolism protein/1,5-bisphosphokinase (PRPP-forming) PhnN n=1 Tax=Pseudomonas sp. GV071 TaxID=2135754 RepID=UPI000D3B4306|nr:phosphonate metabolism protein/1,5-bisphosphokinase (PRPP-forming) PhnN [Pseudomonas sp. GV071]PTQ69993.1 ribose 1,5-bisphosphokinase [Pseudomonas sp. GV071]
MGTLIYLIGPSGSGKDSLLQAAGPQLEARGCHIVRRVITRSAEAVGEEAEAVSPEQFEQMEAQGAFAMSWRANGLAYGIPAEINAWLAAGDDVLVNGSRAYLPEARCRYPDLLAILLTVDLQVLRERLLARGRESLIEINARLARNAQFQLANTAQDGSLQVLDNSAHFERTVAALLNLIVTHRH